MIFNSFFTQILMVVLAVGMLFFYVRPTMTEIGLIQDSILAYQEERAKAESVNAQLAALVSEVNSISAANMKALSTFMPDTLDDAAVMRDIHTMAELSGVVLTDIKYSPGISDVTYTAEGVAVPSGPVRHDFTTALTGEYENIKTFLSTIERNNYPLEVYGFKLTSINSRTDVEEAEVEETTTLKADLTLVTYSHLRDGSQ